MYNLASECKIVGTIVPELSYSFLYRHRKVTIWYSSAEIGVSRSIQISSMRIWQYIRGVYPRIVFVEKLLHIVNAGK